jgi:F-type H+-transporting ATPase subunit b
MSVATFLMSQLLSQLGIDWRLLISQAVNFFLLLIVLWIFVYKPLLKVLHERRQKIEEGIMKSKEADERLHEVDRIGKEKIKSAEAEASRVLTKVEQDAKDLEAVLLVKVKEREVSATQGADERILAREKDADRALRERAGELVKAAIVKVVELSPDKIDDALIAQAMEQLKG